VRTSDARTSPKYCRIAETLIKEIEQLPPGSKFPGVNAIAKRFQVARATAEKVLRTLAAKGYVRQVPGSGTFVADNRPKKIVLLSFEVDRPGTVGTSSPYYLRLNMLLQEMLTNLGHSVTVLLRENYEGPDLERVRQHEADLYVAVGIMSTAYLERVCAFGKPVISVDYSPLTSCIDSVSVASLRSGYLSTRALLQADLTDIWYIGIKRGKGKYDEADSVEQSIGFRRAFHETGLPGAGHRVRFINPWTETSWLAEQMLVQSKRPQAVITFDNKIGQYFASVASQKGIKIPDQLAILAAGGMEPTTVSSLVIDCQRIAAAATQLVKHRLANPDAPPQDVIVWPRFVDQGTVPPPARDYLLKVLQMKGQPRTRVVTVESSR